MIESRRRVGLAAVLGTVVCLTAGCSHDGGSTAAGEPAATAGSQSPPASPGVGAEGSSPGMASASPSASREVRSGATAAPEKSAGGGHVLLTQDDGAVKKRVENTSEGTVEVTTAKSDLTGQQTLRMAADQGEPVGRARCTKRLRFANAASVQTLPSVLLCWRVSAHRSVVTLAVAKKGSPSPGISESIINKEWAKP